MTDTDAWTWGDDTNVTPRTVTVRLCLDGAAAADLVEARRALRASDDDSMAGPDSDLASQVADLEQQVAQATRTFTVRAVPYHAWTSLVDAHQQGKDDGTRWNPETFIPAALAACCEQFPDVDAAVDAVAKLDVAQVGRLFRAVLQVNEGEDLVPPGVPASAATRG